MSVICKPYSPGLAYHLGLFCLHGEISLKDKVKNKISPNAPRTHPADNDNTFVKSGL